MSAELLPTSPQEHEPRRARRLGWMTAVAVAAIVGSGVSWAAIPHSASQLITACYDNSRPQKCVLRVIDEPGGAACTAGETKIRWSGKGLRWGGKWESRSFVGRVEVSGGQITDFVSCSFGTFATSAGLDYEFLFDRVG
jgi:hypothetical protein